MRLAFGVFLSLGHLEVATEMKIDLLAKGLVDGHHPREGFFASCGLKGGEERLAGRPTELAEEPRILFEEKVESLWNGKYPRNRFLLSR